MGDLDQIKADDFVTIRNMGGVIGIEKVIRITKTRVITAGPGVAAETRWKKSTGKEVGDKDRWHIVHIDDDGTIQNWTGDMGDDFCIINRFGKKRAGDQLDGRTWKEMPSG